MTTKRIQPVVLAISIVVLMIGIGPYSTGPVHALPLAQQQEPPPPDENGEGQQQPGEPVEPAVFPDEDEELDAQGEAQPMAYIVNPTMNYQGYLTDAGGSPINDTLTFTASLYDDPATGIQMWGPEVHPDVQVQNGIFSLVLGQNVPLDPGVFYNALYLEIEVDGTTLPRQPLRTVPYAFSLVPGAYMRGDLDTTMFNINNYGDSYGLYVQENGITDYGLGADRIYSSEGYASGADSFLWVPGNLAVTSDSSVTFVPVCCGSEIRAASSVVGSRHVLIPITIPGVLYGHNTRVEEVRIYYKTSNASTYIDSTYVNKQTDADSYEVVASTSDNQASTTATSYLVPVDSSTYTLTSGAGPLTINMYIYFANVAHSLSISGVRIRLGHPRSDE